MRKRWKEIDAKGAGILPRVDQADLDDVQQKKIRDVVKECPPPENHEMQQNTTHYDHLSTAQQMALNAILAG